MIYELRFSLQANKIAKKWKKSNPPVFKKYAKILAELVEHPRIGLGHPEALKGGNNYLPTSFRGFWLNAK